MLSRQKFSSHRRRFGQPMDERFFGAGNKKENIHKNVVKVEIRHEKLIFINRNQKVFNCNVRQYWKVLLCQFERFLIWRENYKFSIFSC